MLRSELRDLLDLVVIAPDRVEDLRKGPHDPAGDERLERDVEVARPRVVVEVEGVEQHRPAEGRELEHDRRIVGDEHVDREQQVVDVDGRPGPVDKAVRERGRDAERLDHERMQLDDDDRVLLDRDRVEPRVVEDPEVEMRGLGPVATERRGVQDRRLAFGLRGRPRGPPPDPPLGHARRRTGPSVGSRSGRRRPRGCRRLRRRTARRAPS